jgi:hypothetical protein
MPITADGVRSNPHSRSLGSRESFFLSGVANWEGWTWRTYWLEFQGNECQSLLVEHALQFQIKSKQISFVYPPRRRRTKWSVESFWIE